MFSSPATRHPTVNTPGQLSLDYDMDSSEGATAKDIYLSILRDLKGSWSDLSLWQQKQIEQVRNDTEICHNADDPEDRPSCLRKAFSCYLNSWLNPREDHAEGVYCPVTFDGHKCWEKKLPGRSVAPCADIITEAFHTHCQTVLPSVDTTNLIAYRDCGADGHWLTQNGNYTACKQYFDSCLSESGPSETHLEPINGSTKVELLDEQTKNVVVYVFTGLAVTSVILLSISFFIFTHFKTLYCNRNSIHKNLCAALLLHVISLLVILSPRITGDETIYGEAWLCKSFMFLSFYAVPASIMWTFVEGLYLSQRLTLAVFKKEAPFKLYYFIGWGFPLVLAIAWALATEYAPEDVQYSAAGDIVKAPPNKCWSEYSKQPYHWIITGPCLVALVVNLMFLIMIIIVLVTKLRANNAVETVQVRKAIKATFILVPLLGISNLLFVANPNDNGFGEKAYIIVNLVLKGSQGIFVALIYCFLNTEVQMAISKSFYRAALRRNPETTQSFRFGSIYNTDAVPAMDRRKSSTRTASTSLVSSTEVLRSIFRSRRSSSRYSQRDRRRLSSVCAVTMTVPMSPTVTTVEQDSPPHVPHRNRKNSSVTFALNDSDSSAIAYTNNNHRPANTVLTTSFSLDHSNLPAVEPETLPLLTVNSSHNSNKPRTSNGHFYSNSSHR